MIVLRFMNDSAMLACSHIPKMLHSKFLSMYSKFNNELPEIYASRRFFYSEQWYTMHFVWSGAVSGTSFDIAYNKIRQC